MTYATLQTDVASYLHRDDLTAKMPGFVALAEAEIFRELAVREVETTATGTTTGALIALPVDFASMVRVTVSQFGREMELAYGGDLYTTDTGCPQRYTIEGASIRFHGGSGYAYTLYYKATIPPLSDTQTTNWVLDNAPDLYLFASIMQTCNYTQDRELEAKLAPKVAQLIDSVRRLSMRRPLPDRGGLQIKPRNAA